MVGVAVSPVWWQYCRGNRSFLNTCSCFCRAALSMRFWFITEIVLGQEPIAEFSARKGPLEASHEMLGSGGRLHSSKRQLVLRLVWQPGGDQPPQISFRPPADSLVQSPAPFTSGSPFALKEYMSVPTSWLLSWEAALGSNESNHRWWGRISIEPHRAMKGTEEVTILHLQLVTHAELCSQPVAPASG